MKLLLSSYCLEPFPLEETFLFAKEIGADGIELVLMPSIHFHGLKTAKELSIKYQIPIVSLHQPPWGILFTGKRGVARLVKKAKLLECQNITVHLSTPRKTFNSSFFDWAKEAEKETGINIAFENSARRIVEKFPSYAGSDPEKFEKFVKAREISITFDVAKGVLCGMDPYQFFQRNRSNIKTMHLHGFDKNSNYHLGFSEGDFDWPGFTSFVKKFDTDVSATLEIFPMHKWIRFGLPSKKVFEESRSLIKESFEILKRA